MINLNKYEPIDDKNRFTEKYIYIKHDIYFI
jgi:hypothetical protein